ncbi:MAG: deoxyribose-phosphate aldolase [Clostridia bacterium]|nr:deoxyribose-phosphate aldolase [Clostridia bacterium]
MKLNKYIDHTLLKPNATSEMIEKLCNEAKQFEFFSVCVNPDFVALAKSNLKGTDVKVACVVGFPLGANKTEIKVEEAALAVKDGADEIDMVINISKLKEKNYDYVLSEINQIKAACGCTLKVIIETSLLTKDEIAKMCEIVNISNAECIKTSTGFIGEGAKEEDVALMAKLIRAPKFVKASGGIRDYDAALKMVTLGAKRLGVSAGVAIATDAKNI